MFDPDGCRRLLHELPAAERPARLPAAETDGVTRPLGGPTRTFRTGIVGTAGLRPGTSSPSLARRSRSNSMISGEQRLAFSSCSRA